MDKVEPSVTGKNELVTISSLLGTAVGFGIGTHFLPGGYDALVFYLHPPTVDATSPAWVYLITAPLGLLKWPWGWQILVMLSVLAAGLACSVWPNSRWWIVVASAPMIWNVWLGQIEIFPVLGLWVSVLVQRRQLHPAWLGVGYLALMAKPQVGAGVCLLVTWWVWREQGVKAIVQALGTGLGVIILTIIVWPTWPVQWATVMFGFRATWWNASIWPYGLLAWLIALLPVAIGRQRRLRMVMSATLLGSPYFALYHCVTLLTLADRAVVLLLSWLPVLMSAFVSDRWMKLGWLLPALLLVIDLAEIVGERLNKWCLAER